MSASTTKKNPHKEPGKEERAELALLPVNQFSLTRWRGAYSLIIIIPSRSPPLPPLCPPRSLSPPLPSSRQDGQQFHLEKRFFLSLFLRIRAPFPEARSLDLGPFLFVRTVRLELLATGISRCSVRIWSR
jgi:hypothetical protein